MTGTRLLVTEVSDEQGVEIKCPHCRKTFEAERIEGGDAARYHGFKCPHCKLFVPIERAKTG